MCFGTQPTRGKHLGGADNHRSEGPDRTRKIDEARQTTVKQGTKAQVQKMDADDHTEGYKIHRNSDMQTQGRKTEIGKT